MAWVLIAVLTLVTVLALLAVLLLAALVGDEGEAERARIELEVRRAERRLHDVASDTFQAMLDEARTRGRGGVS
jgi:cytochrome c-type biogenesis protein CcmH/NrfG